MHQRSSRVGAVSALALFVILSLSAQITSRLSETAVGQTRAAIPAAAVDVLLPDVVTPILATPIL
jgi:hypothetical protein